MEDTYRGIEVIVAPHNSNLSTTELAARTLVRVRSAGDQWIFLRRGTGGLTGMWIADFYEATQPHDRKIPKRLGFAIGRTRRSALREVVENPFESEHDAIDGKRKAS